MKNNYPQPNFNYFKGPGQPPFNTPMNVIAPVHGIP